MKAPVILVLAAAALLVGCGSSAVSPTASPLPSPRAATPVVATSSPDHVSAQPTATATSTAAAEALQLSWSEVPFDGSISTLAADRSRFVAVGGGTDGVAAWTSNDGMTWVEHGVPERSFGEIGEGVELFGGMGQLVRLGDTLYSFGSMTFMDSARGAAWRWTDGSDWEVIESTSEFFDGRPTVVTASEDALVAGMVSFERGLYGAYSTWVWTSATSWVKTALSSSADEEIGVEAIAWAGGTYLAAGSVAPQVEGAEPWEWPRTPAVWTSSNGLDWTVVNSPDGMSTACSVAPLTDGSFAVLGTAGEAPAAWVLVEHTDWVEGTIEAAGGANVRPSDRTVAPCSTVAAGDALLATATGEGGRSSGLHRTA